MELVVSDIDEFLDAHLLTLVANRSPQIKPLMSHMKYSPVKALRVWLGANNFSCFLDYGDNLEIVSLIDGVPLLHSPDGSIEWERNSILSSLQWICDATQNYAYTQNKAGAIIFGVGAICANGT